MNQDEVIGTVGMFWDITDRKQAEIELAEERNLLRTLIDSLPDYIYVKDTESRFVLANRSVSRVMGAINPGDVIGKTDLDFYSPEEAKKFLRDEQQVIQKEIPFYDREENFVAGGSNVWCLSSKVPLKNIEWDVIGLIGIGHDITQRKKADEDRLKLEAQLQQAQKMETVGTLVAGIAHDFNNHLNVINGFSEILCMQTSKTDSNYQLLERITQAGRSAAALIRQLMAFSRKQMAQPKVLNINRLLEDTANLLKPLLGETIELRMNLSQSLHNVKIDPTQMEQVIINIAANAKDAMSEGGVLQIMKANIRLDEKAMARVPELEAGEYVLLLMAASHCGQIDLLLTDVIMPGINPEFPCYCNEAGGVTPSLM